MYFIMRLLAGKSWCSCKYLHLWGEEDTAEIEGIDRKTYLCSSKVQTAILPRQGWPGTQSPNSHRLRMQQQRNSPLIEDCHQQPPLP